MVCWVEPLQAAKAWGVSIYEVMLLFGRGAIPAKVDGGRILMGIETASEPTESTATLLVPRPASPTPELEPEALIALVDHEEPEPATEIPEWKRVRAAVGRTRRPPVATVRA
jgi:hypothetical protein